MELFITLCVIKKKKDGLMSKLFMIGFLSFTIFAVSSCGGSRRGGTSSTPIVLPGTPPE